MHYISAKTETYLLQNAPGLATGVRRRVAAAPSDMFH